MIISISFVDTSAFYALDDSDDANHEEAIKIRRGIRNGKLQIRRLYTSNYILDETLTLIRMHLGHSQAIDFGERIRKSRIVNVVRISAEVEEKAWVIFKKHKDKRYSFTDCTSFALMEEFGVKNAFSFDRNFEQYGFSLLRV